MPWYAHKYKFTRVYRWGLLQVCLLNFDNSRTKIYEHQLRKADLKARYLSMLIMLYCTQFTPLPCGTNQVKSCLHSFRTISPAKLKNIKLITVTLLLDHLIDPVAELTLFSKRTTVLETVEFLRSVLACRTLYKQKWALVTSNFHWKLICSDIIRIVTCWWMRLLKQSLFFSVIIHISRGAAVVWESY